MNAPKHILLAILAMGALFATIALAASGVAMATAVGVGALAAASHWAATVWLAARAFGGASAARPVARIVFPFKLVIALTVYALVLRVFSLNLMGFAIGWTALFGGVAVGSIFFARTERAVVAHG